MYCYLVNINMAMVATKKKENSFVFIIIIRLKNLKRKASILDSTDKYENKWWLWWRANSNNKQTFFNWRKASWKNDMLDCILFSWFSFIWFVFFHLSISVLLPNLMILLMRIWKIFIISKFWKTIVYYECYFRASYTIFCM